MDVSYSQRLQESSMYYMLAYYKVGNAQLTFLCVHPLVTPL